MTPAFRLCSVALAGALLLVPEPASAQPRNKPNEAPAQWSPEWMLGVKQVGSVRVSPDGKRVVFTVRQALIEGAKSEYLTPHPPGQRRRHARRAADARRQLLRPAALVARRQDHRLPVRRSGKRNIWLIPAGGGEARRLTDQPAASTACSGRPTAMACFTAMDAPIPESEKAAKREERRPRGR